MYTYIIRSQNLYKIGKTKNVEERMETYRTHNPSFELIKTIEGDYENILHSIYHDKHSHLEWYHLTPEDVDSIEDAISIAIDRTAAKGEIIVTVKLKKSKKEANLITLVEHNEDRVIMTEKELQVALSSIEACIRKVVHVNP